VKLKITVHGTVYDVDVEVLEAGDEYPLAASPLPRINNGGSKASLVPKRAVPTNGVVTSPIAGTVLEIKCKEGETVEEGQVLVVVEAMKMEASINAPSSGKLSSVEAKVGDAIREGQVVARYI
jgi:biotin carboxyl carrier protein